MTAKNIFEKFYLDSGDNESSSVFIPECFAQHLMLHQKNGVKFLYTQYKAGNPGVIFNDPVVYINIVQVILFVSAVNGDNALPALILCSETEIQTWKRMFHFWTNDDSNVHCGNLRPDVDVKNTVFINTVENVSFWSQHKWSVVVVHHENAVKFLPALKKIECSFHIWVAENSVKTVFSDFASIFEWVNGKETVVTPSPFRTTQQSLQHKIIFETNLEDIFIRRQYDCIPYPYQDECMKVLTCMEKREYFKFFSANVTQIQSADIKQVAHAREPVKKSRKNKDPTGLKVKRTKKPEPDPKTNENCEPPPNPESNETQMDTYSNAPTQPMCDDVEAFIKNTRPITLSDFAVSVDKMQCGDVDSDHDFDMEIFVDGQNDENDDIPERYKNSLHELTPESYTEEDFKVDNIDEASVNNNITTSTSDPLICPNGSKDNVIDDEDKTIVNQDVKSPKRKNLDAVMKGTEDEATVKKSKASDLDGLV